MGPGSSRSLLEQSVAPHLCRVARSLGLPKIAAANSVFDDVAVRNSPQIVDLMRRIRALIKATRAGSAAIGKPLPRPRPVAQRFFLVDGRANQRSGIGANNRARDRAMHIAGDRSPRTAPVAAPQPAPRPVAVSQDVTASEPRSSPDKINKRFFLIWS